MSNKQADGEAEAGKVSARKRKVPQAVDLTELNYLEHRDVTRVANEMKVRADYVSKVKRGESYSVKILAALFKRARENKKALEQQAS